MKEADLNNKEISIEDLPTKEATKDYLEKLAKSKDYTDDDLINQIIKNALNTYNTTFGNDVLCEYTLQSSNKEFNEFLNKAISSYNTSNPNNVANCYRMIIDSNFVDPQIIEVLENVYKAKGESFCNAVIQQLMKSLEITNNYIKDQDYVSRINLIDNTFTFQTSKGTRKEDIIPVELPTKTEIQTDKEESVKEDIDNSNPFPLDIMSDEEWEGSGGAFKTSMLTHPQEKLKYIDDTRTVRALLNTTKLKNLYPDYFSNAEWDELGPARQAYLKAFPHAAWSDYIYKKLHAKWDAERKEDEERKARYLAYIKAHPEAAPKAPKPLSNDEINKNFAPSYFKSMPKRFGPRQSTEYGYRNHGKYSVIRGVNAEPECKRACDLIASYLHVDPELLQELLTIKGIYFTRGNLVYYGKLKWQEQKLSTDPSNLTQSFNVYRLVDRQDMGHGVTRNAAVSLDKFKENPDKRYNFQSAGIISLSLQEIQDAINFMNTFMGANIDLDPNKFFTPVAPIYSHKGMNDKDFNPYRWDLIEGIMVLHKPIDYRR